MDSIKSAEPGSSAQESAITLLRDAVQALRGHPRDLRAVQVSSRIVRLLARFPVHFVTEFLQRDEGGRVTMHRVALSDWPDWAMALGRNLGVADTGQVAAGVFEDHDADALVPGEGDEAIEALKCIAERLGVPCTQEAIEDAIDGLVDLPDSIQGATSVQALRMLWLVVREAGSPAGVAITRRAMIETDWSRAALQREDDPATGNVRLKAAWREDPGHEGEALARKLYEPDDYAEAFRGRELDGTCGTCGEAIKADPLTGTTCACAAQGGAA